MKKLLLILSCATVLFACAKEVPKAQISVNKTTETVSPEGGSVTIAVTAVGSWTAAADKAGIQLSATAGEGNGSVTVTVPATKGFEDLSWTVTFTATSGSTTASAKVTISQTAVKPEVSIASVTPAELTCEGGAAEVAISSNQPWTIAVEPAEGVEVSAASGTAGESKVIVTVPENPELAPVEYKITVSTNTGVPTADKKAEATIKVKEYELVYGGDKYDIVKLSNGSVWMATPLHYVPDGAAISDDPKAAKICYPQGFSEVEARTDTTFNEDGTIKTASWKHSEVFAPLKDNESISKCGLLYSWDIVFGEAITKDNYNTFEGKQGICPKGWHVPTIAEWKALVGNITGDKEVDKTALFYNEEYDGGVIADIEAAGFSFGFTGMISASKYSATNVISPAMTTVESYVSRPSMTYVASSTGKEPAAGKDATQMYALASTFSAPTWDKTTNSFPETGKYPKGRLTGMYANFAGGFVQVRCVRDSE